MSKTRPLLIAALLAVPLLAGCHKSGGPTTGDGIPVDANSTSPLTNTTDGAPMKPMQ